MMYYSSHEDDDEDDEEDVDDNDNDESSRGNEIQADQPTALLRSPAVSRPVT